MFGEISLLLLVVIPPLSFFWDFDTIMGSPEHIGSHSSNKSHMIDFINWYDNNNLVDIPTKGPPYTLSNGRIGDGLVDRRLDRALCNHLWLTTSTSINVSALVKHRSYHHLLLLEACFSIHRYVSSFRFLGIWTLHDNCGTFIANCWANKELDALCVFSQKSFKTLSLAKNLEQGDLWQHS